jgi:hypothetical protein
LRQFAEGQSTGCFTLLGPDDHVPSDGVSFTASLARTASGKLQKQAIRASLPSPAVP